MKIIVDTNIVFSAILNANGTIGDLLFNSPESYNFFSPDLMRYEIERYQKKLLNLSKLNETQLFEAQYRVLSQIELISQEVIKPTIWKGAYDIVRNIDENDTSFVALTIAIDGILWTGDKKLSYGLKLSGWNKVVSTQELQILRGY